MIVGDKFTIGDGLTIVDRMTIVDRLTIGDGLTIVDRMTIVDRLTIGDGLVIHSDFIAGFLTQLWVCERLMGFSLGGSFQCCTNKHSFGASRT